MSSSFTPLQVEDQTDEEFFDKLVDDDYGAGQSQSNPGEMFRGLLNLRLEDVEGSGSAFDADGRNDNELVDISGASENDASVTVAKSGVFSEEARCGAKGSSFKEVQWSAFCIDSQQFGQVGFESDLFLGSANVSLANSQTGSEAKSTFTEFAAENVRPFTGIYEQQGALLYSPVSEKAANLTEMQNWENLYPGWKYDGNTEQWYQLDGYDATTKTQSDDLCAASASSHNAFEYKVHNAFEGSISERSDALHLQRTRFSVLETISESSFLKRGNQVSQGSIEYPPNMVFDPQYPEWYYDTITQQWYTLESYNDALYNASSETQGQQNANVNASAGSTIADEDVSNVSVQQSEGYVPQENSSQESQWTASANGFAQQSMWQEQNTQGHAYGSGDDLQQICQQQTGQQSCWEASVNGSNKKKIWQPETPARNGDFASFSDTQLTGSFYGSMEQTGRLPDNQLGSNNLESIIKHNSGSSNKNASQGYAPSESIHHVNQPNMEQSLATHLSNSSYGTESSVKYTEQSFQVGNPSYSQFSYTPNEGRRSAGRPSHALVTFGFSGKIVVMKYVSSSSTGFVSVSQGTVRGVISIHSVVDIVMAKADSFNVFAGGVCDYFHVLCDKSFPGPLVGGNASFKDVNKWMDDQIITSEYSSQYIQNGELLSLLLSLLKILCQHYGKLRSPYGADISMEGSDGPESLVSKLFVSAKKNDAPFGGFGLSTHCMKNLPSEGHTRATAIEVQNLLVSGKRKEALQFAQEGQLWGPALVLAAQLGDQFFVDTVKQMAHRQLICGSPLRTLCLLIAGQPADVFSADSSTSGLSDAVNGLQQVLPNSMLDDWQENLAIITSNQTKDDELVIIHLGDCLWRERGEVTAAHTCYLVAEANFESYSDSARLCLIGADHWKNPRTYACPGAIQRTEVYEYSKVIGNSQFVLLPFQPYKLVYAYMLAEVGKVSDSLRYCQASMKLLKNSGHSPEVEMWKILFSSLEERLKIHQQGGYGTNLAPTKLVGKLFNSIDRSIHRMIGAPPLPPMPQNSGENKDNNSLFPKVSSSQSAMAITSLMPSASVEAISEWAGDSNNKVIHNRSISEPDFGRSPKQSSSKDSSSHGQGNTSMSGGPSRFGRFGSQFLQKTIGLVSWSRHDRQAKLGESNKFYYDEKLKRWVEEGTEIPEEETSLPPPPIAASFQNGISDYNFNNALKSNSLTTDAGQKIVLNAPSEQGLGFPRMPPSQNPFSACCRMGVRSRYVDTFNKGGEAFTSSFQLSLTPSVKPLAAAKFFVPLAHTNFEDPENDATRASTHEATMTEQPSSSAVQESIFCQASTKSSFSMQHFPSMDNIASSRSMPSGNGSVSHMRAASWSGAYTDISSAKTDGIEQSFVASGLASTLPTQNDTSHIQPSSSSSLHHHGSGSVSDDLHDVRL